MRVGVNGRAKDISGTPSVVRVLEQIQAAGLEVALSPDMASWLKETTDTMPWKTLSEAPLEEQGLGMMISLGGDGSLLDTVAMVGRSEVPVLGINLGRLGFLSNVRLEEVNEALTVIKQGKYTIQDRSLVEVIDHAEMLGMQNFALNEVTLHKRDSASMLAVHVHMGETYLNTYWADGLIVATPTGSTAYSLSCGGPVLDPTNNALILTPISPHNLNVRPFVVPDDVTLHLQLEARSDMCLMNLDSRSHAIHGLSKVTVRKADFVVKMIQIEEEDFLPTLRAKLNWGLDIRSPKVEKNVKR
ncbi:MAG: NAD kinase [Flavobacteriales bacterium]|nr:NAD kinase [Flavobacteriales bacterium]